MIKQVTSVGAAASTIVTPSGYTKILTIQNTGAGNVRLSLDGVSAPTATTGYKLVGSTGALTLILPGGFTQPKIQAILESATATTLDINTNDIQAT